MRKVNERDISKELETAWNESRKIRGSLCAGIGLCMINKQIRRVCQTSMGYRMVDYGHIVKHLKPSDIKPTTQTLLNIPTQTIPVVLADIETLTGKR